MRSVASISDRSFYLISILEKVDLGSKSDIDTKIMFKNRLLKICLGQSSNRSTQNDRNAMTTGWYQVFSEYIDLTLFYCSNLDVPGKPGFPFFFVSESFHKASTF